MFRTCPNKQQRLWERSHEVDGHWRDWLNSAFTAVAMLAPRIRRGEKDAAERMIWTVGQIVSNGDVEVYKHDLKNYTREQIEGAREAVDSLVREALDIFGVSDCVITTLDEIQSSDDPLYTQESWPEIRRWWLEYLG